ncbi:MAG: hypothetical protein AMS14_08405 [Planctomycetes bacterium DG_20]|nr:MAG: hypothetical protein AMS14_08405 [Planctomycetes bacterium DG_20]
MKRALTIIAVVALFGLAVPTVVRLGWSVYQRIAESQEGPGRGARGGAVAVEVAEVRTGSIRDVDRFTGTLRPNSQFVVAPKIGGRLETLRVNIGDRVDSGDLIATLDNDEYVQQVEQARAELKVAEANVLETKSATDVAEREFKRITALSEKKIVSESDLDVARLQYEATQAKHQVALAQKEHKKAALKADEVRLSYTKIQAAWQDEETSNPGDGQDSVDRRRVVGERFVDAGAMLRANDPIVSILDLNTVIAVVHIIERDYTNVRAGQEATVTTEAYPGRRFTGRVIRVAPLLKEASRQARVEVKVPNPQWLLKGGMFVRVELQFAEREDTTLIPVAALAQRDGKQVVFVADLKAKKARQVPVTLGIVNGEKAEVLSPPLKGHVVTLGQHLLSDGADISLPGEAASTRPATRRGAAQRERSDRPGRPGGQA